MRNQILAKLVAKYPGLSKVFLGLLADKIAVKVTEESGIDTAIAELDNATVSITDLATEFQKEGDRRVSDAKKEWDKKNPPKPGKEKTDDDDPEEKGGKKKDDDEVPKWAKGIIAELTALRTDKTITTIKGQAATRFKTSGVPDAFWNKRVIPEKEEDFETFAAEVEKDWTDFKQEQINGGFMVSTPPAGGGDGSGQKPSGKEDADITAWAEKETKKETPKK